MMLILHLKLTHDADTPSQTRCLIETMNNVLLCDANFLIQPSVHVFYNNTTLCLHN